MRLQVRGNPSGVKGTIVGRVVRDARKLDEHSIVLVEDDFWMTSRSKEVSAVITTKDSPLPGFGAPTIYAVPALDHLDEGDLVSLDASGNVNTLYRVNSVHNAVLVTETCNSKCLMCSQPPKRNGDIAYLFDINRKLIPLIPKTCREITITGGEPTLLGDALFEMLRILVKELPETEIHVLTNGRKFARMDFAAKLEGLETTRISFGVPLYSDYYGVHDYIVQAESAFNQTILGLHNLARLRQRIELRVVLQKLTIERLEKLAHFIYKNLPFAEHVAFMALENIGFARYNSDLLWIDPCDYRELLSEAVLYLDSFGMNVSIFNHQLCTLPEELWPFARKSISEWKRIYLKECAACGVRQRCGGFFESCRDLHSRGIHPIGHRIFDAS